MDVIKIQEQIDENRKSVASDSYDIAIRQLYDMAVEKMIDIAPDYQRHFVWDEARQSQLIESIMLGIPVPSLFMATNKDSSWEVIDGLQRLTTIINYIGTEEIIKKTNPKCKKLKITGLEKLTAINGLVFEQLPKSLQMMFMTRPIRVTVLNDRSDFEVRYDLFERLNTGGVILHPQEIRNCVFAGRFNDFIRELAKYSAFRSVVKNTPKQELTGNYEELVLKFFAYYQDRNLFVHAVKEFLNEYMEKKTRNFDDGNELESIFKKTFDYLNEALPEGIVRKNRKNATPLILFEAITIGTANCIFESIDIDNNKLRNILDDEELKKLTTGATNSRARLNSRIDYVKENVRV
ncbi:MAG: DUF262 domain-containing protein [Candidatus Riflebacteria bacterium]|nr:DUF262 domain-containing protein [Candidatus Riflebacteria bacterium]